MRKYNQKITNIKPFDLEIKRDLLAKEGRLSEFEKTYLVNIQDYDNPNSQQFWDSKFKGVYDLNTQDELTKSRISTVINNLPKDFKKILDIGVGYGYFEQLLEENKIKVDLTGVDISKKGIKCLKKRFPHKFICSNIMKLPLRNSTFDVVVALEVLEHIIPKDTFKALSEINRVLKEGGTLLISVPLVDEKNFKITTSNYFPHDSSGHVRRYSKEIIKAELELSGFEVMKVIPLFAFNDLYFLKNIIQKIIKRWSPNILIIRATKK